MANNDTPTSEKLVEGTMYLYDKPELLTKEDHGHLGLTPVENPYEYVKAVRAIPLTLIEFSSAMKYYPIIFSDLENAVPLAIVGIIEDHNLFVDGNGQWDPLAYVPFYLRCHPFAFTSEQNGQVAVVIDRNASVVSENPVQPFFEGEGISKGTDAIMKMCGQYEAERRRTKEFCNNAAKLGLLRPQRAMHKLNDSDEEQAVANYVAIDNQKLAEIDKDTLAELHSSGELGAMYNQLNSLENWHSLLLRRHFLQEKAS